MSAATPIQIHFDTFEDPNGVLYVYESGKQVPFVVHRVFAISAKSGQVRGQHAHRRCRQLLISVSGRIRLSCDNGKVVTEYILNDMATGLLVPPRVWASQEYIDDATLMVLCDRSFEIDDYIRDYDEFKSFLE